MTDNPASPDAASIPAVASPGPARAPAPAPTPWIPVAPLMGGVSQIDATTHAAWTGGLPKADWTGLDPSSPTMHTTPNQLRPSSIGSAQKSFTFRQTGLSTKLTAAGDLDTFEHKIWQHLTDCGMDTIAYVPDPVDKNTMVNCVTDHARFSVESVTTLIEAQMSRYDHYDKANDTAATNFLLSSLDDSLAKDLWDVR